MHDSLALRISYAFSQVAAFALYSLAGLRRAVVRDNLARSFPDVPPAGQRRLRREFQRRQAELAAEVLYGIRMDADELRLRVQMTNPELLAGAAAPRPVIIAASHVGNFEWALLRLSLELGERLLCLYKPMRNPGAERWFRRMRTRFGARLVPAKSVLAELKQFRDAAAIGIVADQVPRTSPDRHWLSFLGRDTAFFMGPELLGRALRSQVLYVDLRRQARGRYVLELVPLNVPGERLPTGELTQRFARKLEAAIRTDPASWWWAHRRWKELPQP